MKLGFRPSDLTHNGHHPYIYCYVVTSPYTIFPTNVSVKCVSENIPWIQEIPLLCYSPTTTPSRILIIAQQYQATDQYPRSQYPRPPAPESLPTIHTSTDLIIILWSGSLSSGILTFTLAVDYLIAIHSSWPQGLQIRSSYYFSLILIPYIITLIM